MLEDVERVIGKIVKFPLENLNNEIQEYFKMTKKILIDHVKEKLDRPKEEILKTYNLTDEKLRNSLFLPEIQSLAEEMKENNFNNFDNGWNTYGYFHHTRAYRIKNLIAELELYANIIEEFRLLYSIKQEPEIKEDFIDISFEKYNLPEFDEFKESINKAAYDEILYRALPVLLRTLFENLLWYIFKDGLAKKHTTLFFNSNKNRIRDFSQLIFLLNQLKDKELIPTCKNAINSKIIEYLKEIQKFGNWNVHEIHNHVGKEFVKKWKEKVNLIINSLIMVYKNINGKEIEIESEREITIGTKLGIEKEANKNQKKNPISITPLDNNIASLFETNIYKRDFEVSIEIGIFNRTPTRSYYDRLSGDEIRNIRELNPIIGEFPKYLIIYGENKSIHPIMVIDHNFMLYDKNNEEWISVTPTSKIIDPITIYNTPLDSDIKLKKLESCAWHYPLTEFKEGVKYLNIELPIRIKGFIDTDDEKFYSEEILLS